MKMAICKIVVTLMQFDFHGQVLEAAAEGKIIARQENRLLMDFSADAKKRDWSGNYSRMIVRADDCIELK